MKLEFIESGAPDCPLIRLYEFDLTEAVHLREILLSLSLGVSDRADLHSDPSIKPIHKCNLTLLFGQQDLGIIRRGPLAFECVFTKETWGHIASLVEPFCESYRRGCYQWLTEQGDAFLLLSWDGSW
jgi:hypothetical protein